MRKWAPTKWTWAVTAASLVCALPSVADDAGDLRKLSWIAGCWASDGGETGSVEQWMPLAGDTLLGVSRIVKNGKTIEHEFMQIRPENGRIAYIALPSGQTQASFPLASVTDSKAVFENPQHDFPQRIVYELVQSASGPQRLHARIEGMRNGKLKGIDYPMTRVSCDGLLK